jgi:adhesin HecA-like repeat protein
MRWHQWFRNELGQLWPRRLFRGRSPGRGRVRPRLEQVENRTLLASYTAASVKDLIADINAANKAGGTNTITLAANTTFDLTMVNNTTDGPTGLPVIANNDNLTVSGQGGDIIQRDTSGPAMRLFDGASGATLTLNNLTLQNGSESGSGPSAEGGAIYNQGTLVLNAVTVENNSVDGSAGANGTKKNPVGQPGSDASGGGIWSSGTLTLENGTLDQNNSAIGGNGGNAYPAPGFMGGNGGNASGAGVYIAGGTADLAGVTLSSNVAVGGNGGAGIPRFSGAGYPGNAFGGGIYVAGGSVTLSNDTVEHNEAFGGSNSTAFPPPAFQHGYGGGIYAGGGSVTLCSDTVEYNTAKGSINSPTAQGYGGGIFIASAATVYIDSFTVANTINNTDSSGTNGSTANIDGTYTPKNC